MIRAIYREREDGHFDFIAAFETDMTPEAPSNWPEEIAEWLRSEGEAVLVVDNCPLHRLPDVWDGVNERRPKEVNTGYEPRDCGEKLKP